MIKKISCFWLMIPFFTASVSAGEDFISAEEIELAGYAIQQSGLKVQRKTLRVEKIEFDPDTASSTKTLYRLKTDQGNFILKEMELNPEKQIRALEMVKQNLNSIHRINPAPALTLPISLFSRKDESQERFFGLFEQAPGVSLSNIFNQYMANTLDGSVLKQCFSYLGQSIATLHFLGSRDNDSSSFEGFRTRFIHGDLHGDNIFYQPPDSFCLIDLETMAVSLLKAQSPHEDLTILLLQSLGLPILFFDTTLVTSQQKSEIEIAIKAFLNNYASQFDYFPDTVSVLQKVVQETAFIAYQGAIEGDQQVIPEEERDETVQRLMS